MVTPRRVHPCPSRGYLNALDRAEKTIEADLQRYLPLWKHAVPAEFQNYHVWDFTKFGRGEQFVYETLPREEFSMTSYIWSSGGVSTTS